MKTLFLTLVITFSGLFNSNTIEKPFSTSTEYAQSWQFITGYHSDGTSASIRYTTNNSGYISEIQIQSNGSWYSTYIKHDENGRKYVKNSNNKRYYF